MAEFKTSSDCEKQPLIVEESLPHPTTRRQKCLKDRLVCHLFPCILLLLSMGLLFRKVFVCNHHYAPGKHMKSYSDAPQWMAHGNDTTKIALEAHIMSKCPDAKYCLQQLIVPTMARVSDKVDFKLSYIGSLEPDSDDVHCKHGPEECLGNLIQLCAASEYPDPKIYLGFANCMTAEYQHIPDQDLVEGCAMEHGIDFQKLNSCISQEGGGNELLRQSVKHSQNVNVSISCTVRLEGKVRCVRDGGKWYNCPGGSSVEALVDQINELSREEVSI